MSPNRTSKAMARRALARVFVATLMAAAAPGYADRGDLSTSAPQSAKTERCDGPSVIDPDDVGGEIRKLLTGKVIGFAFAISDGSTVATGQAGWARIPFIDGNVAITFNTDINVASVSKTITAIAVLQLMEKLALTPDAPIADWLPEGWTKGEGFDAEGITFVDLLTHRSGLEQAIARHVNAGLALPDPDDTKSWEELQLLVEAGAPPDVAATACPKKNDDGTFTLGEPQDPEGDHYGVQCYHNTNYALPRLMIWRMALKAGELGAQFDDNDPATMAKTSAAGYERYVRENVLQPSGVDGFCSASGPAATRVLGYDINGNKPAVMVTAGTPTLGSTSSSQLTCGPGSWWLSALELVKIGRELRCGQILSPAARASMDELKMGWHSASNTGANAGRYWKDGRLTWIRSAQPQLLWPLHPDHPTADCSPIGPNLVCSTLGAAENRIHTCLMRLPFGLDAALVMNSDILGSDDNACDVLKQAFDAAS